MNDIWIKVSVCMMLMFVSSQAIAGSVEVRAEGGDSFYRNHMDAVNISRMHALDNLSSQCKKKKMVLFKGGYVEEEYHSSFTMIQYSGRACETNSRGQEKCTVQVSGHCLSKDNEYFSMKCSDGNKAVEGKITFFDNGAMELFTKTGSKIEISKDTVDHAKALTGLLCGDNADRSPSVLEKVKGYVKGKINSHARTCKSLKENGKDVPKSCGRILASSGVRS